VLDVSQAARSQESCRGPAVPAARVRWMCPALARICPVGWSSFLCCPRRACIPRDAGIAGPCGRCAWPIRRPAGRGCGSGDPPMLPRRGSCSFSSSPSLPPSLPAPHLVTP